MLNDTCGVTMIDFGFAKKFIDIDNKHISKGYVENFQGNILFASADQMRFHSTSRKDDLLSTAYLLLTLLNKQ